MFFDAERASVDLVEEYLDRYNLDVDRPSKGYTDVAHRPSAVAGLMDYGAEYTARYGLPYEYVSKSEMASHGLNSPDFFGAVHLPMGFALNPMKFVLGLTDAAQKAGVRMYSNTTVTKITNKNGYVLETAQGLPTGVASYTLAREMRGDASLMAAIITAQTLLSFVTLPLTLLVGQAFLPLN